MHRVLTRNGLIDPQAQQHKRKYKRWQRQTPMHLWQLDIVGGIQLADGRECKLVTGIDDHSRFVVIAGVVVVANSRSVCEAFTAAMRRYGVPAEVLSDNGKQFTGRHQRPQPVEVLFETICRTNGISQRLTKPRSPTTTGKIERFHKTLRAEFLDHVAPFESLEAAQAAVDGWVESYNHQRPHQALDMAIPASLFRPNGPTRIDSPHASPAELEGPSPFPARAEEPAPLVVDVIEPPSPSAATGTAVEFERRVPPSGETTIVSGKQSVSLHRSLAGRTVIIWADLRSIHVVLDGNLLHTVPSRLTPEDLTTLTMRGARPAGQELGKPALRRLNSLPTIPAGEAVEVDRRVTKDSTTTLAGANHVVGFAFTGRTITLRLDDHLMHAIADNALIGTWPCPVPADQLPRLKGARPASTPLPPPPLPAGSLHVQRRVHATGRFMVAKQRIKLGKRHAGKLVTIVIEDTHLRVLHDGEEIAVRPRRNHEPITRLYTTGKGAKPN